MKMSEDAWAGRVALITGGHGAIGQSIARELAHRGVNVQLADRSPRPPRAAGTSHQADVGSEEQITALIDQLLQLAARHQAMCPREHRESLARVHVPAVPQMLDDGSKPAEQEATPRIQRVVEIEDDRAGFMPHGVLPSGNDRPAPAAGR